MLKGSVNVCVLVKLECCVRACTSVLLPLQTQEEEGTWLPVFTYVGAIENNSLFVAIGMTSCISALCVCPCVCLCVCVSGIRVHLHYRLNLHTGKRQLCPSAWAETPCPQGTELGSGGQAEGTPGSEQRGEVATLLISFSIFKSHHFCFVKNLLGFFCRVSVCLFGVFLFASFALLFFF